jgi:hypothetical protein
MKQFCDKQSSPNAGRPAEAIADSHLGAECPSAWSRDDPSWSILICLNIRYNKASKKKNLWYVFLLKTNF